MKNFLGFASLAALTLAGCTDADPGEPVEHGVAVELSRFDEASVAAALGEGWELVEEGVFERPGAGRHHDRVSFGDAGRRAELARTRAALARVEAAPPSDAQGAEAERLRAQLASLQPVQNAYGESSCGGATFYAQALVYSWWYDYNAYAVNQRTGNSSVAWEPYAYVARYDANYNPWFPVEGYDDPISAQLQTYPYQGCDLHALSRIDVPQCPSAFLHVDTWASCSQ